MSSQLDFIYDSNTFVDLYLVLNIDMDAKQDEIKTAYLGLVKKNHPDHGGLSDKFEEITRAYEILYNKETRKEYDLYYLKKNMDEFRGDDILRLKDQYKDFITSTSKPISKEELDKLYSETFDEIKEKYKETRIDGEEFNGRLNDIELERKNLEIETNDNSLADFMKEHGNDIDINDVFEYFKHKNTNCFGNTSIVAKEWGTLDSMPGYSNGYSSFMDDNEHFGSNLYSNISDMNNFTSQQTIGTNMSNLNMEDFMNWKNTKKSDTKLTETELDKYLKQREEEQTKLFNDVETELASKAKRKEVEKFLKTKHLTEDVERYYDGLETTDKPKIKNQTQTQSHSHGQGKTKTHEPSQSSNLDDVLKYMEKVREDEFPVQSNDKQMSMTNSNNYEELKSGVTKPVVNNVRKREFK